MFNVGHVLSPAMIKALATDFHDLNPKPLGGAPKDLWPRDRKSFNEGLPDASVPPCASCHGPEAKGNDAVSSVGGSALSLSGRPIDELGKERGEETNSNVMAPIAHSLTAPQIKAVAAYLSYLE